MALKLFNTISRKKEEFIPLEKGKVKFYMCGPTVYDYIHIGNGRAFIVFDVLRRFLKYLDYEVTYVMNLTDIDDRIIERSIKEGIKTQVITEKYTRAFYEDIDALGILRADFHPKATDHVMEIVTLISSLIEKGAAYQVNGDVFYDVSQFKEYGKLSGKVIEDLVSGARVSVDEKKRSPLDFALWKSQKPGEPAWQSPWGMGRPGWHIECSVMSMQYLGRSFDIHSGGIDLIFPHHENEIAQSEGATGENFVNYWLHNGFLQIDGDKMAKSLGNFKTVRDVLKNYSGVVIRMYFLQKHYRSPIDFTKDGLESAKSASERLQIFYTNIETTLTNFESSAQQLDRQLLAESELQFVDTFENLKSKLIEALEDDLNTPVALSCLFDMVRETNKMVSKGILSDNEKKILIIVKDEFDEFNSIFNVIDMQTTETNSELVNDLISLIIEVREDIRTNKDWELADKIRVKLDKIGVVLEDKIGKTSWRFN